MNLTSTIIPKSDQMSADDLITGPRTIKITNVLAGTAEQPVNITFEGDAGRPYKPSKSMRRVLVQLWGSEGAAYVGRRITIYRDPNVKFGGDLVGGIKISHASHIDKAVDLMLTATRGKRQPHHVEPLEAEAAPVLKDTPPEWVSWTNEERGANRAAMGTDALKAWWSSMSKDERDALKGRLEEWKKAAATVGA
jgi:hypothetical protein